MIATGVVAVICVYRREPLVDGVKVGVVNDLRQHRIPAVVFQLIATYPSNTGMAGNAQELQAHSGIRGNGAQAAHITMVFLRLRLQHRNELRASKAE